MGVGINSQFKSNYTITKNNIKESTEKTGILEIKSASKTNPAEPIKLQLTYIGHRDKMISAPLRERTSTDGSTQPPSLPVGLRFKSRKDLEKMMAHPKRLNSALNHIASLNLQAPTPLENLSLKQLQDVDALIRICHDKHTPKLLKNAISEQILSNVNPQALLKNPQLLCKTIKVMSNLDLQAQTKPENLSSEKLQDLTALLNIYNDSKTPEPVKQAISNQVLSKIEPQELIENPKLLQENLQLMSSLNLQTFVRGNLNALQKDLANADTENLKKHLEELNTPEAKQNFKTLDRLIGAVKDPKMPKAQKDLIQSFFQHPETGITRQERKGLDELMKHPQLLQELLQENLKLMSSPNLQTFVRGNVKTLQQDLASGNLDGLNKHLKELDSDEAKHHLQTLHRLLEIIKDPKVPKAIKNFIQSSFQQSEKGITYQELIEFEKLCNSSSVLSEQLKETLELQKTVRQATKDIDPSKVNNKKILDIGKILEIAEPSSPEDMLAGKFKSIPDDTKTKSLDLCDSTKNALSAYIQAMKNYRTMAQQAIEHAKTARKKTNPKALMEAYNTAITAYKSAIATYDDEVKALGSDKDNKLLFEARNAMDKLSKIAFHKDTPPELFDLITKNVMEYGKPNNELIMEFMSGVPQSVISTLTAKGLPMIESSVTDSDYFRRRAREYSQEGEPQQIEEHYLFYDIHAENVKNSQQAQDKLLFYNTQDIHERPLSELHTDDIGKLLVEYKDKLIAGTDQEKEALKSKIEALITETKRRLPILQQCLVPYVIFSGFEIDEQSSIRAHMLGFTQNGGKIEGNIRDISKIIHSCEKQLKDEGIALDQKVMEDI